MKVDLWNACGSFHVKSSHISPPIFSSSSVNLFVLMNLYMDINSPRPVLLTTNRTKHMISQPVSHSENEVLNSISTLHGGHLFLVLSLPTENEICNSCFSVVIAC